MYKAVEHSIETELTLMEQYNLDPSELFTIKTILLAQDGEYECLRRYVSVLNGSFRTFLKSLQDKGIITQSYKIPKEGNQFIPEDVQFNKNFLKKYYRSGFEMGYELFETYPQSTIVNGQVYNLKRISRKFDSLEEAFAKYAKYIHNNPDLHKEIINLVKWGIDNGYNFTTLDSFIVDNSWLAIKAMREGNAINVNTEAIQLI